LHAYALDWVERYAGAGHDTVREATREEYRRLLATGALAFFSDDALLGELDRRALQDFVTWLTALPGRYGRLSDRSIHNAVTPLRACLRSAVEEGLLPSSPAEHLVLPRRRSGKPYEFQERSFLSREQLRALLDEIPARWSPLFELLASTGLRISEAIALRVRDLQLETTSPQLRVRRAIVDGRLTTPKSKNGLRPVPLARALAADLRCLIQARGSEEDLVFQGPRGAPLSPNNLRNRVLGPAAKRAGVPWAHLHTLRHTCAGLLVARGLNPLQLERWMGHHSATYTLEAYGHLMDEDLGPGLDLSQELSTPDAHDTEAYKGNPNAKLTIVLSLEDEDALRLQRLAAARGRRPDEIVSSLLRSAEPQYPLRPVQLLSNEQPVARN
jgi:integrase